MGTRSILKALRMTSRTIMKKHSKPNFEARSMQLFAALAMEAAAPAQTFTVLSTSRHNLPGLGGKAPFNRAADKS